jgi:hypothetical protein
VCSIYMASSSVDLHYYGFTLVIIYASEWTVEALKCVFCFVYLQLSILPISLMGRVAQSI